jgi:imidazoleglycerol-phosphate dehydratase
MSSRVGSLKRKTGETDISVSLNLDGRGDFQGSTGIGFLDHMLSLWARHGLFDLTLEAAGDLQVDTHHTVEDIGICLGQAFSAALGEKKGIGRYGSVVLPMDEALVIAAVDISGRSFLAYDVKTENWQVGELPVEVVPEFFRAFADNAGLTLHLRLLAGFNSHHIIEAVFKGCARALRQAAALSGPPDEVPSTKGVL